VYNFRDFQQSTVILREITYKYENELPVSLRRRIENPGNIVLRISIIMRT